MTTHKTTITIAGQTLSGEVTFTAPPQRASVPVEPIAVTLDVIVAAADLAAFAAFASPTESVEVLSPWDEDAGLTDDERAALVGL